MARYVGVGLCRISGKITPRRKRLFRWEDDHGKACVYRTHSSNPQSKFNGWWKKLVAKAKKKHPEIPEYPFGSLRDTFPDIIHNEIQGGGELASLCLHHGSTTSDDLLNLYTKLPFRRLFEATEVLREKFLPMLRILK